MIIVELLPVYKKIDNDNKENKIESFIFGRKYSFNFILDFLQFVLLACI
jgi:hypothetical protein